LSSTWCLLLRRLVDCSARILPSGWTQVKGLVVWEARSDGYEVGVDDAGDLGVEGFDADEEGEVGDVGAVGM